MSFKLIRELDEYQQDDEVPASDYLLAASNPDGTPAEQTFKITIKDVVSQYNRERALEQSQAAENGDDLLGGTFSEVEVIDGREVLIDSTPITSANLNTLIDPGSGLEIIEKCFDATKQEVPCLINGLPNPAVKYKQKKLSFAKSAASTTIHLYVNSSGLNYTSTRWLNEGYPDNSGLFKVNNQGIVDQRFLSIQDAYDFINREIVTNTVTINIYLETDIEEPFFYGNGYTTKLSHKKIHIYGAEWDDTDLRVMHVKHGVGKTYVDASLVPDAATLGMTDAERDEYIVELGHQWNHRSQFRHGQYRANITQLNPNPSDLSSLPDGVLLMIHPCCPFWVNSDTYWRGIHFVCENHGESIFAQYRQTRSSQVWFAQCKFSTKGYTVPDITGGVPTSSTPARTAGISYYFDIRDNSQMHCTNVTDGDMITDGSGRTIKSIDTSGLELDLKEVDYINTLFLIEYNSILKVVEYRDVLHAVNGNPSRTFPSRLTITSAITNCENFFQLNNASSIQANAPFAFDDGLTAGDINVAHGIKANGFNVIRMSSYTDENGNGQNHVIPGTLTSEANTVEDIDYRNKQGLTVGTNLKFYPMYYNNYTNWTVY